MTNKYSELHTHSNIFSFLSPQVEVMHGPYTYKQSRLLVDTSSCSALSQEIHKEQVNLVCCRNEATARKLTNRQTESYGCNKLSLSLSFSLCSCALCAFSLLVISSHYNYKLPHTTWHDPLRWIPKKWKQAAAVLHVKESRRGRLEYIIIRPPRNTHNFEGRQRFFLFEISWTPRLGFLVCHIINQK